MDRRNVVDKYKDWPLESIIEDVQSRTLPYSICMINLCYDFNLGTLIRNSSFFGAKEVYYLQEKKKWDRRSSVGAHLYLDLKHLRDYGDLLNLRPYYNFVAIENNIPNTTPLEEFEWPENPLIIFGSERHGLAPEIIGLCQSVVEIRGLSQMRSLNVGTASGIIMNDFVRKYEMVR